MNVNCCDIRDQLADCSKSMNGLGQAARNAAVAGQDLDIRFGCYHAAAIGKSAKSGTNCW